MRAVRSFFVRLGKQALDFAKQKRLRLVVHLGNEIDQALVIHLMVFFIAVAQNLTGLTRQALQVGEYGHVHVCLFPFNEIINLAKV